MRPKFSVIMPTYNCEKYIQQSIQSVVNQTYKNWELIIIDDGSTDKTAIIILEFIKKDSRIKYLYQENQKQGKARNYGISIAKGNYIAFLDSDDLWLPEKIENDFKIFKNEKIDLIFSSCYIINENNDTINEIKVDNKYYNNEDLDYFLIKNQIPILTVNVKKKALLDVNCFSEDVLIQNAEDYHLWLKLLLSNFKFLSVNCFYSCYRVHNDAVTSKDKLATKQVIELLYSLMNESNEKQKIKIALKNNFRRYYKRNLKTLSYFDFVKNLKYNNKEYFKYFFFILFYILPKKIFIKIFNYLIN